MMVIEAAVVKMRSERMDSDDLDSHRGDLSYIQTLNLPRRH
jgi:hypothetical protein